MATPVLAEASQDTVDAVLAMFPAVKTALPPPTTSLDDEERKARRALLNVPADDYDTWIFVGMALATAFPEAVARALWIEWSSKSAKYDDAAIEKHWRSFKDCAGGKTIAYVYWLAKLHEPDWWHQWRQEEDRRPTPSVSSVTPPPGPSAGSGAAPPPPGGPSVTSVSGPLGAPPTFRPLRPLPEPLGSVPPFDPILLPVSFRGWVEDIANRVQCPIEFPAVAAMVTYSSVIGRRICLRPKQHDNWFVVPNLWGGPVGRPGVMKTPGIQEPMGFLQRLEAQGKLVYDAAAKEHAAHLLVARAREKVIDQEIKKAINDGEDPMAIAREAIAAVQAAPTRRRFKTNDVTIEKLGELLNENPNGVLMFRDELTGFLRSLDKEGHEGARAFYLEAWNGTGAYTFDRIGRGTVEFPAAIISILGGIQPGPLAGYLQAALRSGAADDGLVQRFQLLVYPDVSKDWKNVDQWPLTQAKNTAWEVFAAAASLDVKARGAEAHEPEQIPFLRHELAAQEVFDDWRHQLERKVRSGTDHPAIEAHLAKYRSLVPSLALLSHLADGRIGGVGVDAVVRAIAWATYLEAHARRIYGLSLGNHLECRAVAEHILNRDLEDGFDARQVYRSNWSHLNDPTAAECGIEQLIQFGWLAEQAKPTRGRTATIYRINPKIWEGAPEGTARSDRSPLTVPVDPSSTAGIQEPAPQGTDRTDRSSSGQVVGQAEQAVGAQGVVDGGMPGLPRGREAKAGGA